MAAVTRSVTSRASSLIYVQASEWRSGMQLSELGLISDYYNTFNICVSGFIKLSLMYFQHRSRVSWTMAAVTSSVCQKMALAVSTGAAALWASR